MNVEMVSTSLVTRETSEPRRSAFWVSTDRSWTCRKARTRRRGQAALGGAEQPDVEPVRRTGGEQHGHARRAARPRGPGSGRGRPARAGRRRWSAGPRSARGPGPTVAPSASSRVTGSPARNSGDSARPRRSVAQARLLGRPESVIVAIVDVHAAAPRRDEPVPGRSLTPRGRHRADRTRAVTTLAATSGDVPRHRRG